MKHGHYPFEALPALEVRTAVHYEMTEGMGDLLLAFMLFCDSGVETLPECSENPNELTESERTKLPL